MRNGAFVNIDVRNRLEDREAAAPWVYLRQALAGDESLIGAHPTSRQAEFLRVIAKAIEYDPDCPASKAYGPDE